MIKKMICLFVVMVVTVLPFENLLAQQKFESGPLNQVKNSNHFSLGVGGAIGASIVKNSEGSGIGYQFYIEPTYTIMLDPWTVTEISLILGTGSFSWENDNNIDITMPVHISAIAQVGYGKAFSKQVYGIFNIGAGGFMATLKSKNLLTTTESDSELGIAARGSGGLRFLASPFIDFTAGLALDWRKLDDINQLFPQVFLSSRIKI